MPIKTTQITTDDDTKRCCFAPIRRDLLERLTRECDSKADRHWNAQSGAVQTMAWRKLPLR